jgi:hypothetical protein
MSPTRSLIAAAGLTALVIAAVLAVGARQGAFTRGPDTAAAVLPAEASAAAQDTAALAPDAGTVRPLHRDNDEDDHRPSRRREHDARSGNRTPDRMHDDHD